MPLILLTNDDGVHSPGLWAAAERLAPLGDLWIAAPREQCTSASRSLPNGSDGRIDRLAVTHAGREWTAYAVGGSPAQTVLHALLELLPARPDLVVSGINYGLNLGPSITVSGTIGAAVEGAVRGIPAVAVSLEVETRHILSHSGEVDFSAAAHFTARFAARLLACPLPPGQILKLEIPAEATPATPCEVTRLAREPYYLYSAPRREQPGQPGRLSYTTQTDFSGYAPGTDAHALLVNRAVALTAIDLHSTAPGLEGWFATQ